MVLSLFGLDQPYALLAVLLAFLSALFICIPFHEFAHSRAACKEGDCTSMILNRHTLAPHAHIDAMGLIMLLFFGIGFAKPVPVDPRNFKRGKKSELRVAVAGVVTNFLIGVIASLVFVILCNVWPKLFEGYGFFSILYLNFFKFMISLNFMFAFFNLLPIYPLDGYRIVDAFSKTDNNFLKFMRTNSFWIMLILLFTGILDLYIDVVAGGLSSIIIKGFDYLIKIIV